MQMLGDEREHLSRAAEFPSQLQQQLQMGQVGILLCETGFVWLPHFDFTISR